MATKLPVLHLLNDDDLQTLKRHNAHYTDEIPTYLRAEPIVGNCYFWSAPWPPFVLPVRIANFESVCQQLPPLTSAQANRATGEVTPVAQAVREALEVNPRLGIYQVRSIAGLSVTGWLAFSSDYLQAIVARLNGPGSGHGPTSDPGGASTAQGSQWLRSSGMCDTPGLSRAKIRNQIGHKQKSPPNRSGHFRVVLNVAKSVDRPSGHERSTTRDW